MDLEATNHMPSRRVAFDVYKVIASRNVYLDNDSVFKVTGMRFIIIKIIVRAKVNQICVKDVLHMPKLQVIFAFGEQPCVERFKSAIRSQQIFLENMITKSLQLHHVNATCTKWILRGCIVGKQHRVVFQIRKEITTKPMEIVYFDMCVPHKNPIYKHYKKFCDLYWHFSRML